jgi:glycerol-3-phosphate acyltransferase PlsY
MEEFEVKQTEVVNESKGLSIASMVLGIVSLVMLCIWYVSIPCAILAIIFAIVGRKKGGKGMATAGLVLGIIALAIDVVIVIGVIGLVGEIMSTASMM